MSRISKSIPQFLSLGSEVVSPGARRNITARKIYTVQECHDKTIVVYGDDGTLSPFPEHYFIEADVFFTMCFFSTLQSLFFHSRKNFLK